MTAGITHFDELSLWGRPAPGRVTPGVQAVIALAAMLAVGMVGAAVYAVRALDAPIWGTKSLLYPHPAPVAMMAAILVVFAPPSQVSRFVRLAIALPLIHVLALVVVWVMFLLGGFHVAWGRAPVVRIPAPLVALALGGATLGAAWLIARRRRNRPGEVAHAAVVLALANLLLLGLWLPLLANILWFHTRSMNPTVVANLVVRGAPLQVLAVLLIPPFALACAYTALTLRKRRPLVTGVAWLGVGILVCAAVVARWRAVAGDQLIYESFAFAVLAALAVAIGAVIALGATTWLTCKRDRRALAAPASKRGTVAVVDGEPADNIVACVEITSWLRGPRSLVRPFVATSARDDLPVPSARVAADLPLASTLLRTGEAIVILRGGDAVAVAGFETATDGDGPYREGPLVMPAAGGLLVGTPAATTTPLQSFCLAVWRPSVAYLLIAATVMLPAIIGLARTARW